jgi:hypothetical protein
VNLFGEYRDPVIAQAIAKQMVRPDRLERPTLWFEARCSIQLSYGRVASQ